MATMKLATLANLSYFAGKVAAKYAAKASTLEGYGIEDAYTKTAADAAVQTAIAGKADSATTLEGYGISDAYTKTAADAKIDEKVAAAVAAAYKVQGSVAFAELPAVGGLAKADVGKVYNVTNAFQTTADFVEGAGASYPAGTNVVVVEASEGVFKYDALAGVYDLTPFVKGSDIEAITDAEIDALFTA